MKNVNSQKRLAAYKFMSDTWGDEYAQSMIGEGWNAVYLRIQSHGFAWSERQQIWHKSMRPTAKNVISKTTLKRYSYARISLDGAIADVEYHAQYWQELVSIDGWGVWRTENAESIAGTETTRITIFIRKER